MADQTPRRHPFGQRRTRRRRPFAHRQSGGGHRIGQLEALLILLKQHQRQIAAGAQHVRRDVAQIVAPGRMLFIHQRQENLRTDIAGAGTVTLRMFRQRALFAPQRKIGAVVAAVVAVGAPERTENLFVALPFAGAVELLHRIDFIIERTNIIDHQMIFMAVFAELLALGDAGKQVDDRRAVQRQMAAVHYAFQRGVAFIQQQHDLELAFAVDLLQQRAQLADADKLEARRKGEVLL